MKTPTANTLATLTLLAASVFVTTGCEKGLFSLEIDGESDVEFVKPSADGKSDVDNGPTTCMPDDRFFLREVWAPVVSKSCYACHNSQGSAKETSLVLFNAGWGNYLQNNLDGLTELARTKKDGESVLLLKATGRMAHGGGTLMEVGDESYQRLEAFITRAESDSKCDVADDSEFYQDVQFLDYEQTFRKASLSLAGRMPTQDELNVMMNEGLDPVMESVLTEDAFYDRLVESFNDTVLTDRFASGDMAVQLLDEDMFPNRDWYGDNNEMRNATNLAIAREPLEIIAFVVRENRPFSDVLNADYTVVNPFSARAYGLVDNDGNCLVDNCGLSFSDMNDANDWQEARIPGMPHAGVLTTPVFLNRYPTTPTNRNRQRSGVFYKLFLATDVLKLADRPLDPLQSDLSNNPTLFDPQCNVCHDVVDPVAGAFQNWDDKGTYNPRDNGWYTDMLPPGIEKDKITQAEAPESLSWLAHRSTADPRFIQSAVEHAYRLLTGDQPLQYPLDPTLASYESEFHAYEVQYEFFKQIGKRFVESNYNFKTLVKEIVKSPYYRALDARADVNAMRQLELKSMGTARLLSPEQLNRKIIATTGRAWEVNNRNVLLDRREFNLLYGGIDSFSITKRMDSLNSVASSIARRMSNEVSCLATANDFGRPVEERLMFPSVELTDTPDTNAGAIRENIRHLYWQLLGEKLEANDPEVERAYQLFAQVWQDGQNNAYGNLPGMCRANGVDSDNNYTVRSWMAVVSYMLSSYEFLYE